jgi:hypothetical protein
MALTDQLISYWDLSEASGTRVDSVAASANNLTDHNTVTGTTGPGSNNASLFTRANSESLSHIDNASLSVGDIDFTFCIWVKYTTLNDFQTIGGQWESGVTQASWAIFQQDAPQKFVFSTTSNGSTGVELASNSFGAATAGVWNFVLVEHDSVNNTKGIQINNGTLDTVSYSAGVFNSSSPFELGCINNDGGGFLNGALAMAGFWKRILTSGDKTQLYNSGNGLNYAALLAASASGRFGNSRFSTQAVKRSYFY